MISQYRLDKFYWNIEYHYEVLMNKIVNRQRSPFISRSDISIFQQTEYFTLITWMKDESKSNDIAYVRWICSVNKFIVALTIARVVSKNKNVTFFNCCTLDKGKVALIQSWDFRRSFSTDYLWIQYGWVSTSKH